MAVLTHFLTGADNYFAVILT